MWFSICFCFSFVYNLFLFVLLLLFNEWFLANMQQKSNIVSSGCRSNFYFDEMVDSIRSRIGNLFCSPRTRDLTYASNWIENTARRDKLQTTWYVCLVCLLLDQRCPATNWLYCCFADGKINQFSCLSRSDDISE